ncbi:hypothetical protein WOSG25_110360 [Weissella oryzae SG25]|uniref:Uncharacterized protein n=1 Tax=Weissella oryzae (strain DSM 25784 / JCM 18191 / LMG 30913 / SG25) TaxID=1329250 RepID=A0A069CWF0_WEIOS|nr:toprim domain-containing protein [Weissella oryzae]GAK31558.1 hypothetical protein WOSG25_110360 [Weissella oryzae SG25]
MAKLTKEQWAQLKELPILGYLDYKRIPYTRDSSRWYRLEEPDSLVIDAQKNTFRRYSNQASGDLGNFISEYERVSPSQALSRWLDYARNTSSLGDDFKEKYKVNAEPDYDFDWSKIKKSNTTEIGRNYLINERKMNPKFVDRLFENGYAFEGKPYKDSTTESKVRLQAPIYFPWRDENNNIVGADRQGTTVNFEKYSKRGTEKKIQRGSNSEYGYNLKFGSGADKLIVFEAPIDLLSYVQQNIKTLGKENTTVMALSGSSYQKVFKQLQRMDSEYGKVIDKLVIATDNDLTGYRVANNFNFDNDMLTVTRQIPVSGKDWNDQLKAGVTGINEFSIKESKLRLDSLEDIAKQDKLAKEVAKSSTALKDDAQVLKNNSKGERKLTPDERRIQTRKANEKILTDAMAKVAKFQRDPKEVRKYLDFISKGGEYSSRNSMLIYAQHPDASYVKGAKQFKNLGFYPKKGEKAMRILGAPKVSTFIVDEKGDRIPMSKASEQQKALVKEGKLQTGEFKHYPIITVFDVKQTTAKESDLPKLLDNRGFNLQTNLEADQVEAAYKSLAKYAETLGVQVIDKDNDKYFERERISNSGRAKGFYATSKKDPTDQRIFIRQDLPMTDKVATLAHEVGHASLHNTAAGNAFPREVKELQAEMTSYVVLKHIGIEPGEMSEKYMHDWTNGMKNINDPKGLVLGQITQASTRITNNLDADMAKILDTKPTIRKNPAIRQNEQVMMNESSEKMAAKGRTR